MAELDQVLSELRRVAAEAWAVQTILLCLIARAADGDRAVEASLIASIDNAADLLEQLAAVSGQDSEKFVLALRTVEQMRSAAEAQRRLPS